MSNQVNIKGVEVSTDHYIDGKRVSSEKKFSVINPNNPSEVLAEVSRGDDGIAQLAVDAARKGFNVWSEMTVDERSHIMHKLADLIEARAEKFTQFETIDNGKPLTIARAVNVALVIDHFRYYAGMATKIHGETIDISVPYSPSA